MTIAWAFFWKIFLELFYLIIRKKESMILQP
jgi:hypothetical protein